MLLDEAAPNFDDPLGLIRACHGRMLKLLELMERMIEYQTDKGVDKDLSDSAQKVLRYFDIAAPLHHQDEELDLFPLIQHDADLAAMAETLEVEHAHHDRLWSQLRPALVNIVEGQSDGRLNHLAPEFIQAYRDHIAIENDQLLPAAAKLLQDTDLSPMGERMAARRQA